MTSIPIILIKLIALSLSLSVAYLAFYAYRQSENRPMVYVSVGFVFIGIGAICEGLILDTFDTSLFSAALVQTILVSVGMLLILRSIVYDPDQQHI